MSPWAILIRVVIVIVWGLYILVKESLAAAREAQQDDAAQQADAKTEANERGSNGH